MTATQLPTIPPQIESEYKHYKSQKFKHVNIVFDHQTNDYFVCIVPLTWGKANLFLETINNK